ncbi:hypothetical protein [Ralstonia syzygii]|nr:hypothetical protein [Ralstonia syzygii]
MNLTDLQRAIAGVFAQGHRAIRLDWGVRRASDRRSMSIASIQSRC